MLSKEALTRFATKGFHNNAVCREDGGAEDAEFGKCEYLLSVRLLELRRLMSHILQRSKT